MSKTKFTPQETIAINNFIENFHECINKYNLGFCNEEKPSILIRNNDYIDVDSCVIIRFWDTKVILKLSYKRLERLVRYETIERKSDDDERVFLVRFSYRKQSKLENIDVYDSVHNSIEEALGEVLKIIDSYVSNKSAIDLVDNLFIEKFNDIELNEIERLKSQIEKVIKDAYLVNYLKCRFKN